MLRKYAIILVGLISVVAAHAKQQAKECFARVEARGSLPPLPALYACVRDLTGKEYDAARTKSCLDSILSSGFFESGHIEVTSGDSNVIVLFILAAPSVVVSDVNFDVPQPLREQMLAWIQSTGDILKAGQSYRGDSDDKTKDVLGFYFRDIGKKVGITRVVNLDYQAATAHLTYQITVGPDIVPTRALPPYEKECRQRIAMLNFTDVDDYVPVNLVDKMTKTHAFGCFSASAVSEDGRALQASTLFGVARYDVQGDSKSRQIYLHIQGKPLKIEEVRIVGYGLRSNQHFANEAALPLRPGDSYRRSVANASEDYLRNKFAEPNQIVEVTEDDKLTSNNDLIITFNVLAYQQDRVTIDGKEFRVPPLVINLHS